MAQENVNLFRSEDPEFIVRMRENLKEECAFVLDVKQAVRAGKDPIAMCAAMGENLVHVHINDNDRNSDCLLPGFGTMDFNVLKNQLEGFGFAGDLIIEVYRRSFTDLKELEAAKRTINTIF